MNSPRRQEPMKQVCLLTGRPGIGKTSLIKQAVAQMTCKAGGFYTEEIRNRGVREGFNLITLDGEEAILAHVNTNSPCRVSKYGVDVDTLEKVGIPALRKAIKQCDLVIIDEIGKMELFSVNFQKTVTQMIDGGTRILGTIMYNRNPWTDTIKDHHQVNLLTVTRDNHHQLLKVLTDWLRATAPLQP